MQERANATILISIDALRCDFDEIYDPSLIPTLNALSKSGVRARHVIPQFNTLTLPNHTSIATGLYAENHGMVSNCMFDHELDDFWKSLDPFYNSECHLNVPKAARWWKAGLRTPGAMPVWTANEKQGGVSGVFAWPFYDLPFSGVFPQYSSECNCLGSARMPAKECFDTIVDWVLHPEKPANFVAGYYMKLDVVQHGYGVKAAKTLETLAEIDAGLAHLKQRLEAAGVWPKVNLIITSDHGHVDLDVSKFTYLDDVVSKEFYMKNEESFWPLHCSADFLYEKLSRLPYVTVYTKEELRAKSHKFHFSEHWRIGPVVVIPDESGFILRSRLDDNDTFPYKGNHGYSFDLPSMWPCFIATGPDFKQGLELPVDQPLDQVDIAGICCKTLGIKAPPSDSSMDRVQHFFKAG